MQHYMMRPVKFHSHPLSSVAERRRKGVKEPLPFSSHLSLQVAVSRSVDSTVTSEAAVCDAVECYYIVLRGVSSMSSTL